MEIRNLLKWQYQMEIDIFLGRYRYSSSRIFHWRGLKTFKNSDAKNSMENLYFDDQHELISESKVHYFMGISKEDARMLIADHPDIPHIKLNGKTYYPKAKLSEWLMKLGD